MIVRIAAADYGGNWAIPTPLHCAWDRAVAQGWANCEMKNETKKTTEAQLLDLLKKVLPKATHDAQLAGKIYQAIKLELKAMARSSAFKKFRAKVELPDLEPKSLEAVKTQLVASFGESDVFLKPNRKEKNLAVEISLPDGTQFSGEISVNQNVGEEASDEQEITLKSVPSRSACLETRNWSGCLASARTCHRRNPASP